MTNLQKSSLNASLPRKFSLTNSIFPVMAVGLTVLMIIVYAWMDHQNTDFALRSRNFASYFTLMKQINQKTRESLTFIDEYHESFNLESKTKLLLVLNQTDNDIKRTTKRMQRGLLKRNPYSKDISETINVLYTINGYISLLHRKLNNQQDAVTPAVLQEVQREVSIYLGELNAILSNNNRNFGLELNSLRTSKFYLSTILPIILIFILLFLFFISYRSSYALNKEVEEQSIMLTNINLLTDDMIIATNEIGKIILVSRSARMCLGYHQSELLTQPVARIFEGIAKEQGLNAPLFKQINEGEIIRDVPIHLRTKAGEVIPAHISGIRLLNDNKCNGILLVIKNRDELVERHRLDEQTNRMKSDFVSIISHELRSPLAVVKAALDILNGKVVPKDREQDVMDRANNGVNRLIKVVTDLTDLAKMEAKLLPLNIQSLPIKPLI